MSDTCPLDRAAHGRPAGRAVYPIRAISYGVLPGLPIYKRLVKCLTQGLGPDEALATNPAKDNA